MCNWYKLAALLTDIMAITGAGRGLFHTEKIQPDFFADTTLRYANGKFTLDAFPDLYAPIVANVDGAREVVAASWGMPSPAKALFTKAGKPMSYDPGVTNVRNLSSPHWRRWFAPEHRCVVPFTRFSEPEPVPLSDGKKPPVWFAAPGEPLLFFAGIWQPQHMVKRKARQPGEVKDIFAFLTTEPNELVKPVHPKAMPVILTSPTAVETWLTAPWADASKLAEALPVDALEIVGRRSER